MKRQTLVLVLLALCARPVDAQQIIMPNGTVMTLEAARALPTVARSPVPSVPTVVWPYKFAPPASLVAADGTYLGTVSSSRYDTKSIANPYGRYGSPYSPTSVTNPYSTYGSPYSTQSATNPYATTPPSIVRPYLGQLSANPYLPNSTSNTYGPHGSPYSGTSITNPYSPYAVKPPTTTNVPYTSSVYKPAPAYTPPTPFIPIPTYTPYVYTPYVAPRR